MSHAKKMSKLYVLTYQEVQIAGYRIFASYDEALKEYLRHCILETRELIREDEAADERSEDSEFDEMTCIFEVQQLEDKEYVTTKEYDYEAFQALLEEHEDTIAFLDKLEEQVDRDLVPGEIRSKFSE